MPSKSEKEEIQSDIVAQKRCEQWKDDLLPFDEWLSEARAFQHLLAGDVELQFDPVAIPAVMGYNIFASRLNRVDGELEGFGSELIAVLVREGRI